MYFLPQPSYLSAVFVVGFSWKRYWWYEFPGHQCLSQYLETGCLKLAVVKFLGVQMFKGDHNIFIFQP